MNLPNYFLADLPPETPFSPEMISDACLTLKRNRAQYLAGRSTQSLIETIAELGERWLDPQYPFRQLALDQGPAATGFSRPVLEAGIDSFFAGLTFEELERLVSQEFGHAERLDRFVSTPTELKAHRQAMACGPELLGQITAGRLPNPTIAGILFGLLLRSSQCVKCATGTAYLPRLFAHSLYDLEPKLGACLEIVEWPGGTENLEAALFSLADGITATGTDEMLAAVRRRIPPGVRFVGYGHRVSFGYVTREMLSRAQSRKVVAAAATDVVAWDQSGCLSPHVVYVEHGGSAAPEQFAEALAWELARCEATYPRGALSANDAATIASRRALYQVRAAASDKTRIWQSKDSTVWTVVYEADQEFQISCLNRFVYVTAVADPAQALASAEKVRGKVSTVGLAAPDSRAQQLGITFARWGISRICPLGKMQSPPLTWRHDGRPALGELAAWSDWEE